MLSGPFSTCDAKCLIFSYCYAGSLFLIVMLSGPFSTCDAKCLIFSNCYAECRYTEYAEFQYA
jgi:hypothetical protein